MKKFVLGLVLLLSLLVGRSFAAEGLIWEVDTKTLTLADTEYTYTFGANTVGIDFIQCRTAFDVRISDETGKVATSTNDYATIKAGRAWYKDNINIVQGQTIYFASSQAGVVVEIGFWRK